MRSPVPWVCLFVALLLGSMLPGAIGGKDWPWVAGLSVGTVVFALVGFGLLRRHFRMARRFRGIGRTR